MADERYVDTSRLRQVIKDLRVELDRVNLAIERIEAIAETVKREQQAGADSLGKKPRRGGRQ